MRQVEREMALTAITGEMETLVDGILRAYERCETWAGRGYPSSSYPETSIASGRHSDPVGDIVARQQADRFAAELEEADEQLQRIRTDVHALVTFINRNTALAITAEKGGRIHCGNPVCGHRMSGIGNDRPRVGRCPRCYTHFKRYNREWPLKAVAL